MNDFNEATRVQIPVFIWEIKLHKPVVVQLTSHGL